jgi:hypothetical protein
MKTMNKFNKSYLNVRSSMIKILQGFHLMLTKLLMPLLDF